MTVEEATDISDNALEHTVRCIMAAVQAPEVLDSSRGAFPHHWGDCQSTQEGCCREYWAKAAIVSVHNTVLTAEV